MQFTGTATSTEKGPIPGASQAVPDGRRFHLSDAMLLTLVIALGLATTRRHQRAAPLHHQQMGFRRGVGLLGGDLPGPDPAIPLAPRPPRALATTGPTAGVRGEPRPQCFIAVPCDHLCRHAHMAGFRLPVGWVVATFLALLVYPNQNACSVVAAWVTLAICGLWRPEASWPDRLGRALGVFWLCAAFWLRLAVHLSLL